MENLKIGIIIPDRGDRPKLLANCLRMINQQTMQPYKIALINEPPKNDDIDIGYRYRTGYDQLRNCDLDAILLMENDDWYDPRYIERFVYDWQMNNKPDLFGYNYTIYYHIHRRGWLKFDHHNRASAMNTLIKPDLDFDWCPDNERYADIWLWHKCKQIKTKAIAQPLTHLCMGIKHGFGKTGGELHVNMLDRYKNHDPDFKFLEQYMDRESFLFFTNPNTFKHD